MKKADKATTYKKTCGFLSDNELVEYLTMFPNPDQLFKEVPIIRERRELWKTSASDILSNLFKPETKSYELSEWNMWQSSDQERYLVTKSKKSDILCDVLRKTSVLKNESVSMREVSKSPNGF